LYVIEDIQDIDTTQDLFKIIDPRKLVTILDRRSVQGRYDDVLILPVNPLAYTRNISGSPMFSYES